MSASWLSIKVELIEGAGEDFWPRPARIFAASPAHTFAQLAAAIEDGFARWDRGHLHEFQLADGSRIGTDPLDELGFIDDSGVKLRRLKPGEQFVYVFDFGDDWTHLCTTAVELLDANEMFRPTPKAPVAIFGWGSLPDQYGRRFERDSGDDALPPDPEKADLPPLRPTWGDRGRGFGEQPPVARTP